ARRRRHARPCARICRKSGNFRRNNREGKSMRNRSGSTRGWGLSRASRVAILMALAAVAVGGGTAIAAESQADQQAVRQADQAWVNAMNKWNKAALRGLMAQGF